MILRTGGYEETERIKCELVDKGRKEPLKIPLESAIMKRWSHQHCASSLRPHSCALTAIAPLPCFLRFQHQILWNPALRL